MTLLGIDQDEWLTDPYCWRKHVHPEDLDRAWEEYEDAYNNHTTLVHEYRMVHEDGTDSSGCWSRPTRSTTSTGTRG